MTNKKPRARKAEQESGWDKAAKMIGWIIIYMFGSAALGAILGVLFTIGRFGFFLVTHIG